MKHYKDFEKEYIGSSDIAALILVGCQDVPGYLATEILKFGGDDAYSAYMVKGRDVEIGEHYEKVATFKNWMKVYDDSELTQRVYGTEINVYRAGYEGCIIQVIND